jgi:hypothetical protein
MDRFIKQVLLRVGTGGQGSMNGDVKGGQICSMYFIYLYEDKALKAVKIILSK